MNDKTTPRLFTPLQLRGLTLRNRIMVSPMAQYCARQGVITDWHFAHFARFATGGAGLVFVEATKPERRGLGTIGDMGLWNDEQVAPLKRITAFLRQHGAASGVQLNHTGRKAGTARPWEGNEPLDRSVPIEGEEHWEMIAPSAIPFLPGWPTPRPMTRADIHTVIESFAASTRRALAAGFDTVEIHGAHGYLVHQFLSPAANQRTDEYGGSLANRMRFALELTEAVRAVWPDDKPLFFRVSAVDEGGWTLEDTVVLSRELKAGARGVDVMDCSASGIAIRSPTASRGSLKLGFQVPYAERVRRDADMSTAAVGLILYAQQAEDILAAGQADLIAIGRQMLWDPFWPAHAAKELGVDPFKLMPDQYGWWLNRREQTGYPKEYVPGQPG
jgi:2,4-dienoyl-CoA reductase-like NADH-dependent reductase (Old Yellow Enzyme family)